MNIFFKSKTPQFFTVIVCKYLLFWKIVTDPLPLSSLESLQTKPWILYQNKFNTNTAACCHIVSRYIMFFRIIKKYLGCKGFSNVKCHSITYGLITGKKVQQSDVCATTFAAFINVFSTPQTCLIRAAPLKRFFKKNWAKQCKTSLNRILTHCEMSYHIHGSNFEKFQRKTMTTTTIS